MAFESPLSLRNIPAVHAKPDVVRVDPEGQRKREDRKRQEQREKEGQDAHPIPNAQGQITGKLIDTTA